MKYVRLTAVMQWLLLIILLAAVLICSASPWVICAAALVILFMLFSVVWNIFVGRSLKSSVRLTGSSSKSAVINGEVNIRLGILQPLGAVSCVIRICNELTGEEEKRILRTQVHGQMRSAEFSVSSKYSGRLNAAVEKLVLYDSFGLIPIFYKQNTKAKFTVFPDTFPLEPDPSVLLSFSEDGDSYQENRRGNDPTEIFQLREYIPGDNIRGIHWKLSSKVDSLIFREAGQPMDRSLLIYWDRSCGSANELDALSEAVFSVCRALCELGYPYMLGWAESGEMRTAEISSQEQLLENLPQLLRRDAESPAIVPNAEDFGRIFYFTAQSELRIAEENIMYFYCGDAEPAEMNELCFTPENYREVLQRLDF